jgi:hypothetical protein
MTKILIAEDNPVNVLREVLASIREIFWLPDSAIVSPSRLTQLHFWRGYVRVTSMSNREIANLQAECYPLGTKV